MSRRLKLAIPWILSLAFVGYLFATVDFEQVGDAIARARILELVLIIVGMAVVVFVADSATLLLLFRRLTAPVRYREVLAIKGVSYFFNAINYSAGSGGIALFLKKKTGVPFLEALSTLLWLNFIDILVLVVMLAFGMLLGSDLLPEEHARTLPWVLLGVTGVAAGSLVYWNLGFDFFVLGRVRSWRIFDAFRRATAGDYGVMMASRLAFIFLYVVLAWATLPTFDITVGFGPLLIYVPVLTFVQIVPASISGLGAIQEVMIAFYGAYTAATVDDPRAQVFAYTLVIGPFTTLVRIGIGYLFVANIARDFVPKAGEIAAARAEEQE